MLNLQLAILRVEPAFKRLSEQVRSIAGLLEEQGSRVPMIQQQLSLIQEIQSDEWWRDVTVPMLENLRRRLRSLVKLIEKQARKVIYTDFEDELGGDTAVELPGFASADSFEKFRDKARAFLRQHEDHLTIRKLRMNEPLTALDLQELERIFAESGGLNPEHLTKARADSNGLGLFVRSLVGMDREAAKSALGAFVASINPRANQILFLDEVVNHLTEHGCMEAARLYESPYTDFNSQGVDGLFEPRQVEILLSVLDDVRQRATA